ncbi:MAG: 8-oxoguanine deaminase [Elusimicrobia bacterium CG08_land_8_20_14_0_20_51_18]|nr:MAG: 8-oxoguanine deaminase [Elusimicrobia bacterium CG08_land_8_20_14_0_20_51_18]
MNDSLLIKNASWVATMDDRGRELKDCDIYIEGPEIKRIGKNLKVHARETINAAGCLVLPGLINTHHHLYQTLTRNLPAVQDAKLFDWLVYLYDIWKRVDEEAIYTSAQVGLGELLLTGCTTSSDHLYLFPSKGSAYFVDAEIEAAKEIGIRFTATRGSMSRGRSKGGLPPDSVVQKEDFILRDCERLVNRYHDRSKFSMTNVAMAPCSPFSVTTELLKLTAEMAKKWDVRMHTHLAETADEDDYCKKVHKMRPLEYMESVGWLDGRSWFAHCVFINEKEAEKMGKTRTGVAHCPCSNLRLGSGIAPVRMFLDKNVPVAMAVDGSASNDSCNILAETRQAMLVSRVKAGVASMPARDALKLATRGGAEVLGRTDIGSLEPGKAADLAVFDLNKIDYAGSISDPVASILFCGPSQRTKYTVVNGKIAVKNGRLTKVDEFRLTEKANKIAAKLMRKK